MHKFFGKIKETFEKVKGNNQQEIDNVKDIIQSFSTATKAFEKEEVNKRLELITQNFQKWNIYIINESSLGLYYCESHNKRCIQQKINSRVDIEKRINKKKLILNQIERTKQEIKQIADLSNRWCFQISSSLQQLH